MKVKELRLTNFRKFKDRSFSFQDNFNVIVGKNGTGKTSLLESIYILSSGRSFTTTQLVNCITFGEEYFFIESSFKKNGQENSLSFLLGKDKKELKQDGKKLKGFASVIGNYPALFMNYALVELVKGGPENRREFVNHVLIFLDRTYYKDLIRFYSLLEKRNAHLKSSQPDLDFIKVISEEMYSLSVSIIEKRKKVIDSLSERLPEILFLVSGLRLKISVGYYPSDAKNLLKEEAIKEEIYKKRTLYGIHLDDVVINVNGREAREYSSLGEAYSLAFAMKFIEKDMIKEEKHENPVLLLDDFFSDLDEGRRENILKLIKDEQVFITSITASIIEPRILSNSRVIMI